MIVHHVFIGFSHALMMLLQQGAVGATDTATRQNFAGFLISCAIFAHPLITYPSPAMVWLMSGSTVLPVLPAESLQAERTPCPSYMQATEEKLKKTNYGC